MKEKDAQFLSTFHKFNHIIYFSGACIVHKCTNLPSPNIALFFLFTLTCLYQPCSNITLPECV